MSTAKVATISKSAFRAYLELTKPGIIMGNGMSAIAGFMLASKGPIDYALFVSMLMGLSLVMASACVFNNYIDRECDAKMERTKHRALVTGRISPKSALVYSTLLGLSGILLLGVYTNLLTMSLGLLGFLGYVILYSFSKYSTSYATVMGSFAGAIPPTVGYCSVSSHFDLGALLLYAIIVFWQMPHFYAIALYRKNDYQAASIPILPLTKGVLTTKIHMLLYTIAFTLTAPLLSIFGYTSPLYLLLSLLLGASWCILSLQGFKTRNDVLWARKMFIFSLIAISSLCVMISVT